MKTRFITGIFIAAAFIAVVLLSLCVSRVVFDAFAIALMLLASFEIARALTTKKAKPLLPLIFGAIVVGYAAFFLCYHFTGEAVYSMLAFTGAVLLAALVALLLKLRGIGGCFETITVLIYPVMVLLFLLLINYLPRTAQRANTMVLLFLVAPFTDVFAYLVGSTLRGPKLCPSISPKKTISGAIGGLVGGSLGGLIVFFMAKSSAFDFMEMGALGTGADLFHLLALGLLGAAFTQCGDLMASYVKRKVGIKDYGRLLPGHGGIMDRIDGMMVAAMLLYVYALVLFG